MEPFGSPADDDRVRLQCAVTWALGTERGTSQLDWLDRTPDETARTRSLVDVDDEAMESFFAGMKTIKADEPKKKRKRSKKTPTDN